MYQVYSHRRSRFKYWTLEVFSKHSIFLSIYFFPILRWNSQCLRMRALCQIQTSHSFSWVRKEMLHGLFNKVLFAIFVHCNFCLLPIRRLLWERCSSILDGWCWWVWPAGPYFLEKCRWRCFQFCWSYFGWIFSFESFFGPCKILSGSSCDRCAADSGSSGRTLPPSSEGRNHH